MIIRSFKDEDFEPVLEVLTEVFDHPSGKHIGHIQRTLSELKCAQERHTFVCEIDFEIVGFAMLRWSNACGVIDMIVIRPANQGQNLGYQLLTAACRFFQENTESKTVVLGMNEKNTASIRLCEKFGFVHAGRLPTPRGGDGLRMTLDLGNWTA